MRVERAVVIYNPAAGRRRVARMRQAVEVLRGAVARVEARPTRGPGEATGLAREAAGQGVDLVVACGGDGTVNEVINGVAETRTALGILPAGTANVLARELGIPADPVRAAGMLPGMQERRVALGRVWCAGASGRYFALACGAGVDAELMAHAVGKRRWGMLAYWAAGLRMLGRRLPALRVETEGSSGECSLALACRVRRIGGGLRVARRSHLLDEEMEVVLFPSRSTWRYVGYLAEALAGRVRTGVVTRTVVLSGEGRVEVDGECVGRLPAKVEIVPDVLTLLLTGGYARRHG